MGRRTGRRQDLTRASCAGTIVMIVVVVVLPISCSPRDGEYKDLRAANERIRVLEKSLQELREKYELAIKEKGAIQNEKMEVLKEIIARLRELHRKEKADLEGQLASLRFELATVQKENIVLRELAEARQKIPEAKSVLSRMALAVYLVLLVISIVGTTFAASKYRSLNSKVCDRQMMRASEVERGEHDE